MATFYLLPTRRQIGQRFSEFLADSFPWQSWPQDAWADLAEALAAAAQSHPDVYVVFREDLGDGHIHDALVRDFGAQPGDEVIEVLARPATSRRWHLAA